jgi:hypothetical protein
MNTINRKSPVIIYAGFNVARYSHWLQGLREIFDPSQIFYSVQEFPEFDQGRLHGMPIRIGVNPGIKLFISAGDGTGYNQAGLEWCDVFAKWTLLLEKVPVASRHKIIAVGPRFDIRVLGALETLLLAVHAYIICKGAINDLQRHFKTYFQQYYFRRPESEYVSGQAIPNYVFYASTLYPNFPKYNAMRATFIEACRSISEIKFEGGLIRKDQFRVPEFSNITITKYYSPSDWLQKTRASMFGFWAPGDQGAMTLKLAEFMACCKAIIAMPIRQEQLPSLLVHGEHVHFVDGSMEEMKSAVHLLTTDHDYRQKLERNARKYYEEWVAPAQAVRRFIREGCKRVGLQIEEI